MRNILAFITIIAVVFCCSCGGSSPPSNASQQIAITPLSATTIVHSQTVEFNAAVTNDTASAGVTWAVSGNGCTGDACGTMSYTEPFHAHYTAPPSPNAELTATVTARSVTDPTKSASVTVAVWPHLVITTASLFNGAQGAAYSAVVQNSGGMPALRWSVSGGALPSGLTLNPNTGVISGTPTTAEIANFTVQVTDSANPAQVADQPFRINIGAPTLLKEGDYAFLFNGWKTDFFEIGLDRVAISGHFHADGAGNITDGVQDINEYPVVLLAQPLSGTYSIYPDGQATFTITSGGLTSTWHAVIQPSGEKGTFLKVDVLQNSPDYMTGSGSFEKQDTSAFSLPALTGPYAVQVHGGNNMDQEPLVGVGRFSSDAGGMLSAGVMDMAGRYGCQNLVLTGSLGAPSASTGRGTAALSLTPAPVGAAGSYTFVYYIVSANKIWLVQADERSGTMPALSGEARRQNGTFSLESFNVPVVFRISGQSWREVLSVPFVSAAIGRMSPDGAGGVTGIRDENTASPYRNQAFSGSYSVDVEGRSVMTLQPEGVPDTPMSLIAYFIGANEAFLINTTDQLGASGSLKAQFGGPFTAASAIGAYMTNAGPPPGMSAENVAGLTNFNGSNAVTSTLYFAHDKTIAHGDYSGSYAVADNGRGTMTIDPGRLLVFWVISPNELVGIMTMNTGDYVPVIMEYRK